MQSAEYPKLAAVEDRMWYFRALHARIGDALAERLGPRAEVLDAGCGTGGLIRRLGPMHPGWRWTGVDLEPQAVRLARDRVDPFVRIQEASVTALPFAPASFDAVVSADVLYHLEDDAAALAEAFRVLRPGGSLVLNVPAYPWLWSYHDVAVGGRRRYRRAGLLTRLALAGFSPARASYCSMIPLPLVVARRKLLPAPSGGSDVALQAPPVEAAFRGLMHLENAWLRDGGTLPFGTSILALAQKPRSAAAR